jgi:hypothetical protein
MPVKNVLSLPMKTVIFGLKAKSQDHSPTVMNASSVASPALPASNPPQTLTSVPSHLPS